MQLPQRLPRILFVTLLLFCGTSLFRSLSYSTGDGKTELEELKTLLTEIDSEKSQLDRFERNDLQNKSLLALNGKQPPAPGKDQEKKKDEEKGLFLPEFPQDDTPTPACPNGLIWSRHCQNCMNPSKHYIKKINYVHIPKAAGCSFTIPVRSYLDCAPIGKGCWGDPEKIVQGNKNCGGRLSGCYGLNPLKVKNSVLMLREPVSRVKSAFQDRLYPAGTDAEKEQAKNTKNLVDYVSIPGISNCQTKMLIGLSCTEKNFTISKEEIKLAQTNLEEVDMFGLVEHYKTSICLLYHTFGGLPRNEDFGIFRKSKAPEVILDAEEVKFAASSEFADIDVYWSAKALFRERLAKFNQSYVD